MKINEIITESTELEEGWKSKLGAAALAGAAAFGGGSSDVQAQNYQQPQAQSQQAAPTTPLQREIAYMNRHYGVPSTEISHAAPWLGGIRPYYDAGLLTPEEGKLFVKYDSLFFEVVNSSAIDSRSKNKILTDYNKPYSSGKQQIERNKGNNMLRATALNYFNNLLQMERMNPNSLLPDARTFRSSQSTVSDPQSVASNEPIVVNGNRRAQSQSSGSQSPKSPEAKQINSDTSKGSGSFSSEDIWNKGNVGMAIVNFENSGHNGVATFDVDSDVGKKLMSLPKNFDGELKYEFKDSTITPQMKKDFPGQFDGESSIQKIVKIVNITGNKQQTPSNVSNTPTYKQNQAPAASQSPRAPQAQQNIKNAGFEAKTTGNATGTTKNGDRYTGEWRDGLANGNGERTLVNTGYTGGLVKTGNKLDTEWKNGMPVDGAKVKVTRPDGTVFNGRIKRTDETPWKYSIVK